MSVTARNDWHPRYHRDALEGMRSLSLEERGAYTTLLDLMYERGGGVPDDDRFVAGHMGCSTRLWRSIRDRLISAGKISVQDGLIVNARAIEELRSQAVRARKRAESGAKGGRTPRQNGAAANENSDLGEAKTKHNNNNNNNNSSEDKSSDAVRVVVDHDRDAWNQAVTLLTGQGGMKAEKARPFFGRLLRDNGLEARDLLPSISKATVSGTQDPQGYLTRAAQAVAKRRAEPTKPKRVGWV
jgi:uncharacterized protein YdaU (DUF1376 family)